MKLDFQNIGGVRLVPAGGGQPVVYGWDANRRVHTPHRYGWVDFSHGTVEGTQIGMVVPNARDPNRPLLEADDRVYLDGAKVLDATGETFSDGGYLGTVTTSWRFVTYTDATLQTVQYDETVTADLLGVVPGPYSGGLRVDGLSLSQAAVMQDYRDWLPGNARYGLDDPFTANGEFVSAWNWHSSGKALTTSPITLLTSRLQCCVGYTWYMWAGSLPYPT